MFRGGAGQACDWHLARAEKDGSLERLSPNARDTHTQNKTTGSARLGVRLVWVSAIFRCRENFVNARSIKKVRAVRKQLADLCKTHGICLASCGEDMTPLHRCAVVMS